MTGHEMEKALEVWTLQNLFNLSIVLGLMATGLVMAQRYLRAMEKQFTLRISAEIWRVFTVGLADGMLVVTVLIGGLVLNPDIMADIKIAVPFCPVATLLFAAALVVRLFHGGQDVYSPSFSWGLRLMCAADVLNVIGFTFVMEAPSGEYLASHPSAFWTYIKTHLRSNADPAGLELSQVTFYVCFPLLLAIAFWAARAAKRQLRNSGGE